VRTGGLDGLGDRVIKYKREGASFAKWRAVLHVGDGAPSERAIHENALSLARYAAICKRWGGGGGEGDIPGERKIFGKVAGGLACGRRGAVGKSYT
jgi:hypothetical protein